ncbi:MAG TPA: hypothetical protein VFV86_12995, partial [Nitrososphaeraceae archaeon]|nr:hypothetical protein [Nitrososphaeraceae archaeon]
MSQILNKKIILYICFVIAYIIISNSLYLSIVNADLPDDINEIENCKNGKIVKKAISDIDNKDDNNKFHQSNTKDIENFHHIKEFNSNGVLVNSWGIKGTSKGEFLHPHGIGSDSHGNIYVSDAVLCNIQKFDNNGN